VLVFSQDEDLTSARSFWGSSEPTLSLRSDPGAKTFESFGAAKLPASFLVVDGRLVARFAGPKHWDARSTRQLLEKLLLERGVADPAARALTPDRHDR
jgi:thioredoxin-like negative regulator of GroEL